VLNEESTYGNKPLTDPLIQIYQELNRHACAELLQRLVAPDAGNLQPHRKV
jgi:hypothetical protein